MNQDPLMTYRRAVQSTKVAVGWRAGTCWGHFGGDKAKEFSDGLDIGHKRRTLGLSEWPILRALSVCFIQYSKLPPKEVGQHPLTAPEETEAHGS